MTIKDKGKRTSNEKIAKVVEEKINTDASAKDIANKLGMSERTTSRIIKENLAKIGEKSTLVANLVDRNNNLQSMADVLISEILASKDEKITLSQLTQLRESTFKQNQLLQDKPTDNVQVNDFKNLSTEELLARKNK